MKNRLMIILYVLCIITIAIDSFKSGYQHVQIYQILFILCFGWLLINKVIEVMKEKKK